MAKNQNRNPAPAAPNVAPLAPAINVVGSVDSAKAGEQAAPGLAPPPSGAEVSSTNLVEGEKKETYREHQSKWKSKAESAAEAEPSVDKQPPRAEIPGKYRKFSN